MTASRLLAAGLLMLLTSPAFSAEPEPTHSETVEQFVAAFNAHDTGAMAQLVADDIEWLSIAGDKIAVETKGKSQLVASMDAYFASCPSCQSILSKTISTPGRVSAVEVASWQGDSGPKSQRALSVYEFSEGLIQRVYYFPAEQ